MNQMLIDDTVMMLSEYDTTKRNKLGAPMLLDHLLQTSEDLVSGGVASEGLIYKERTLLIRPGEPLPQLHEVREFEASDGIFRVKIMQIKRMVWAEGGAVIITILGSKEG